MVTLQVKTKDSVGKFHALTFLPFRAGTFVQTQTRMFIVL